MFQPRVEARQVGDCRFEQLGLALYADGSFVLSYRVRNGAARSVAAAEANPPRRSSGGSIDQLNPGIDPVRHHRTRVATRLLMGSSRGAGTDSSRAAGIMVDELESAAIHVAPGEERMYSLRGTSESVRRFFDEVTLAEFVLEVDPPFNPDAECRPAASPYRERRCGEGGR